MLKGKVAELIGAWLIVECLPKNTHESEISPLRETISTAVENGKNVLLNMELIKSIDSLDAHVLVLAQGTVNRKKGQFKLWGLTERVEKYLKEVDLYEIFQVLEAKTLDEAKASLNRAPD